MLLTLVSLQPTMDLLSLWLSSLTEETRRDLAKEVKKVGENAKVAIRNIRRMLWMKRRNKKSKRNHRR